jgi:hypothetical protein
MAYQAPQYTYGAPQYPPPPQQQQPPYGAGPQYGAPPQPYFYPSAAPPEGGVVGSYGALSAPSQYPAGTQTLYTDAATGRHYLLAQPQPAVVVLPSGGLPAYVGPGELVYADDAGCALAGLILAFFIPLAGWITLCANSGAPVGSRTRRLSVAASLVGSVMFVVYISIGFWSARAAAQHVP